MTEILAKEEMTMTPINTLFDGAAPQGRMFAAASSVFAAVKSSHDVVTVAIDQPAQAQLQAYSTGSARTTGLDQLRARRPARVA